MAKIYETPLDVERDKLAKQAEQTRNDMNTSNSQIMTGALVTAAGSAVKELETLKNKTPSSFRMGFYTVATWVGLAGGVTGLISWFSSRNKAAEIEKQRTALGAEEIRYPTPMNETPHVETTTHRDRVAQDSPNQLTR